MLKNSLGRELPEYIEGYGKVRPYQGAFAQAEKSSQRSAARIPRGAKRGQSKAVSLEEALDRIGLRDGMTVSFHHHLRNGDRVTNLVMEAIARRGVKDIHLAPSGLFACHEPLVPLIEDGTITQISVSTFGAGPVAQAISAGKLQKPAILRTHGGRPRAIENGELHIDVAFVAAPSCDAQGNMNGSHGPNACGCLAYSYADVRHADWVVAVTDNLVEYPCCPVEISEDLVDYVVQVDAIGDPEKIATGASAWRWPPRSGIRCWKKRSGEVLAWGASTAILSRCWRKACCAPCGMCSALTPRPSAASPRTPAI